MVLRARLMALAALTAVPLSGYAEDSAAYDNNITQVVGDFTNAVLASYNLPGFQPAGNALLRSPAIAGGATGFKFDQRSSNAPALNVEWRRAFGARDQGSLYGLAARQRAPDTALNESTDSLIAGAGWLHQFEGAGRPLLYGSLLTGQDSANSLLLNGADNGKRYTGGRVYSQLSLAEKLDLFCTFGLMRSTDRARYARSTAIDYGSDHLADLTIGVNWRPVQNWTVRPQATYSENRSNIASSEYRRSEATVTLRYDFH